MAQISLAKKFSRTIVVLGVSIFADASAHAEMSDRFGVVVSERSASLSYEKRAEVFRQVSAGIGARYTRVDSRKGLTLGRSGDWSVNGVDLHVANIFVSGEFEFWRSVSLGMNLDLVGFTTGPKKRIHSPAGLTVEGRPIGFNAFLTTINDRGTLNSEFYAGYRFTESWSGRMGLSHQVVEYEASLSGAPRLQRFYDLFFVGLDFNF